MTWRFGQTPYHSQHGGILSSLISLLFLIVLVVAIYVARRPLLRFAGESWVVEDPIEQADAILLLSDDNFFADRATRASELFRQKLAPVVVASGRRLRPSAGIAELMEHDLIERGAPKDRIIRFPHDADNTREEAEALRALVAERNWHRVIVVTSNYHTRRARYIFQRVFPESVKVRVASARDGEFDVEHWWENRKSLKEFTREIVAMMVAMWELHGDSAHRAQSLAGLAAPGPFWVCYPGNNVHRSVALLFTLAKSYTIFTLLSRGSCPVLRKAASSPKFEGRGVSCGRKTMLSLKVFLRSRTPR